MNTQQQGQGQGQGQGFMEQAKAYGQQAWAWYQQQRATASQQNAARVAIVQQNMAGQTVQEYAGADAMQRGIMEMTRQGWRVQSQSSFQPRAGCMRVLMLGGIGALVFKPKPHFLVTFTR